MSGASYRVRLGDREFDVTIEQEGERLVVVLGGARYPARWERGAGALRLLGLGERAREVWIAPTPDGYWVASQGVHLEAEVLDTRAVRLGRALPQRRAGAEHVEVRAPMPGRVASVRVQPGQEVARGTVLLTLEAMKMENELRAPQSGQVAELHAEPGTAVERGALLVVLTSAGAPAHESE